MFEKEGLTKARSTIPSNMDLKTSSIPGMYNLIVSIGFLAQFVSKGVDKS